MGNVVIGVLGRLSQEERVAIGDALLYIEELKAEGNPRQVVTDIDNALDAYLEVLDAMDRQGDADRVRSIRDKMGALFNAMDRG